MPISTTSASACSGSALTFSATGSNLLWYSAATGGVGSTTAPSYSAAGTYTAYVSQTVNGCESDRLPITAEIKSTVSPIPTNTTPAVVCSGSTLTFSATGNNLLWYNVATGGTGTTTAPVYTAGGTYVAYVSQTIDGCESARLQINAVIPNPSITVQPTNQSDCDGNSVSFKITASTTTGGTLTYQWQLKKPSDAGFTNIASATANTLNISNVGDANNPAGTQYQCIVSENGCPITSNVATLSVNSVAGTLAAQTLCEGASTTFDVSGFSITGTPTYQWQKRVGTSGSWLDITGATTSILSLSNVTSADDAYYKCKFTFTNLDNTTCIRYTSTGNGAKLTVNAKPALPISTTSTSACSGSALTFSATGSNLLWYSASTGGVGSTTAPSYSAAGTYTAYVSQTVNGCESDRLPITAEIKSTVSPIPTNTTPAVVCSGSTLTFSATGNNLLWYNVATGGTGTTTAPTYTAGGTYVAYVSQTIDGCESARLQINAVIPNPTITVQPSNQSDCDGNSVSFKFTVSTTTGGTLTYQWQLKKPSDAGFTNIASATANTLNISNIGDANNPAGTQYQCIVSENGCPITSNVATLSINSVAGSLAAQTLCEGASTTFDVSGFSITGTPTYQWQKRVGTSGSWLDITGATTSILSLSNVSSADDAYYRCKFTFTNLDNTTCIRYTSTGNGAKLTVNAKPSLPISTTSTSACSGSALTFSATGSNLLWYNAATGGTGSTTAPSYSAAGTYTAYVSQTVNGCESDRLPITAEIKSTVSPIPTNTTPAVVCSGNTLTFSATGNNLLWYNVATGGTGTTTAPTYTAGGTYVAYVSQTIDGCESARLQINAVIPNPSITVQPSNQSDCDGNSVSFKITASTTTGGTLTYQWQLKKPSDATFTNIASAIANTLNISNIGDANNPAGTQYQCIVSENGCPITSNVATLSVNSVAGSLAAQTLCEGASTTFDVSGFSISGTSTYQWQKRIGTSGSWLDITGATTSILSLSNVTSADDAYYRCKFTFTNLDNTTCIRYTSTGNGAKLTVNAKPALPISTTVTSACSGSALTFSATGSNLLWYSAATGGTGSTTAPSYSAAGTYTAYVSQTVNGCESDRLPITAEIKSTVSPIPTNTTPAVVCSGSTLTFSATGNNLLWYNVATGGTGTTVAPTYTAAGTYNHWVSATNDGCESSRLPISAILRQISITTQPVNQTDCKGNSTKFTVTASAGGFAVGYQWQRKRPNETDFTNISDDLTGIDGALRSQLTVSSLGTQNPEGTQFRVIVAAESNCPPIFSNPATLHVNSLSGSLPNLGMCVGGSLSIDVKDHFIISGTPKSFQWQTRAGTSGPWTNLTEGGNFVGVTTSNIAFVNATTSLSAYYRCAVLFDVLPENGLCTEYTDPSKLTVSDFPPTPDVIAQYEYCQFEKAKKIVVYGVSPYDVVYYMQATGGTGTTKDPTPTTDVVGSYNYYVAQRNAQGCESVNRAVIKIIVHALPQNPVNTTPTIVQEGTPLTFTANGEKLLWYTSLSDKTPSFDAPIYSTAGTYKAYVSQMDQYGCESNRTEILATITPSLKISKQPTSQTDCKGNSVTFSLTAKGNGATTYQWQRKRVGESDFVDLPNETANSLTIKQIGDAVNPDLSQYRCIVKDSEGTTTSVISTLFVNSVTGTLSDITLCEGKSADLNLNELKINGTILTYEWQKRKNSKEDWVVVSTAPSIPISSVTLADSAQYRVHLTFRNTATQSCIINTDLLTAKVIKTPIKPTTIDAQYCQNATAVALKADVLTGNTLRWYMSEKDTVGQAKAIIPATNVAGNFSYFVSQINKGGCESNRTEIKVKVNPTPTIQVADTTYCLNAKTLELSAKIKKIALLSWYSADNSTKKLATPVIPKSDVAGTTSYFGVASDSAGCESLRKEMKVNIVPCIADIVENCGQIFADSVAGNKWFDIYDKAGNIYASVNPYGQDLGRVTLTLRHYGMGAKNIPITQNGTRLMSRYFDFQSSKLNKFSTPVSLKIYYSNQEFEDYKIANNLPNLSINDYNLVHYDGIRENCGFEDNDNFVLGESVVIYKNISAKNYLNNVFSLQFNVPSFSEVGATANTYTELTKFTAEKVGEQKSALTKWNTLTEIKALKFIVQRSSDNKTWANLGEVEAKKLANSTYEYPDYQPLTGKNYYRLIYIDQDGTKKFLDSVLLEFLDTDPICTVFPNPVVSYQFDLYLRNIKEKEVRLYNITGQEISASYTKNDLGILRITPAEKLQDMIFVVTLDENGKKCINKVYVK